jgi:hypothetical protein
MAVIEGQIEPLKKLKEKLRQNGITRFGSIGEINDFIKNYDAEKNAIPKEIENELDSEINQLHIDLARYQRDYEDLKNDVTSETHFEIKELEIKLKLTREKSSKSLIYKILCYPKTKVFLNKKAYLESDFENIVSKKTHFAEVEIFAIKEKLNDYTANRDALISKRCVKSSQELESTKEVVDSLYNLIAGAIGENLVIKEVQKLSDSFHLFNDFSLEFNPPIYNKNEDDRIYSIQIDHLLVCGAGIFILETKNWGKHSLKNLDLRSPVKQILRSSYALFVLLNSQSEQSNINLEPHHWGSKQIPIRNLIVMTNAKPKEEFKHVKVLSLKELNRYVTYFDPIFNGAEIESICDYLRTRML